MGKYHIDKKAKEVEIKSRSKDYFLLFHGYTGSPTDFNNLPKKLNKEFNASVKVPLLKGHGTHMHHLEDYQSFHDYVEQAEKELKKVLKSKKRVVLGGYSFGGQLALYLAAKYNHKIRGVFSISAPYPLSYFLSKKPLTMLMKVKRAWRKPLPESEVKTRKNAFYYDTMPRHTLHIIRQGIKELKKNLHNVKVPMFLVNSKDDVWIPNKSSKLLIKRANSGRYDNVLINHKGHNLFYSKKQDEVYKGIIKFFKKIDVFNL